MDKGLAALNHPFIRSVLFHPRLQQGVPPPGARDLLFAAADGVKLGARLFAADKKDPFLLYFHGNGEIAEDYDDVGPLYRKLGVSLCVVDFRGYGASEGEPTAASMLEDALAVLLETLRLREREGFTGPLAVMGRSLGSASALEIARRKPDAVSGLILESAFSRTAPLINLLTGGGVGLSDDPEDDPVGNLRKIRSVTIPTLVIHAEYDHIIPLPQGEELFEESGAPDKSFFLVKNANHNDIFFRDLPGYLSAVVGFVRRLPRDTD
ncbi:MAG: alpha/beta fold hydrolase [Thermodesulfobacteriota bacterium]